MEVIRYQLLFERKGNFKINVCLMNQKAAMYSMFQFINTYMTFIIVNNFHLGFLEYGKMLSFNGF